MCRNQDGATAMTRMWPISTRVNGKLSAEARCVKAAL
jgi:hypothetical protein